MLRNIEQLAKQVGEKLKKSNSYLVTAESCTGGGLAYYMTHVAGASEWFERGLVTYSNDAKKELVNVSANTLNIFGAVSEQTALEMAKGALKNSHAEISIAVTGIAGPTGGTVEKPVGTVWFALANRLGKTKSFVEIFKGDRNHIREQAILRALENIIEFVV